MELPLQMTKEEAKRAILDEWRSVPPDRQEDTAEVFLFASRMMLTYLIATEGAQLNEFKNWLIADREARRGL